MASENDVKAHWDRVHIVSKHLNELAASCRAGSALLKSVREDFIGNGVDAPKASAKAIAKATKTITPSGNDPYQIYELAMACASASLIPSGTSMPADHDRSIPLIITGCSWFSSLRKEQHSQTAV